jgi:small subunit ribosomal protein S15
MPLTTTQKQDLINTHQTHGTDTGSVEVQVAMLSKRLLSYLKGLSQERYSQLIAKLGIRG